MRRPTGTYRLQLRDGVGFDTAAALLPKLSAMGFSHLYLSPIFTAQPGSTHGYDVTDSSTIDPALGGEEAFVDLSEAAHAVGLGVIVDIVPNHMAFSTDTPWLHDVLRNGRDSAYAEHFDIDWSQRLVLPWLPAPFADMAERDEIRVEGGDMVAGDLRVPLSAPQANGDLSDIHDAQCWRLTKWERERDSITHRRFFNVTGLIGVRVEDRRVFEDHHAKLFELVDRGLVDGIRIDHIDGLADPADYLGRLRARVGALPVWVEKILTDDETLPDWPVQGTTGYEVARQIARVLTAPDGLARLERAWEGQTGTPTHFHDAVIAAKGEVLRQELAAELHQLIALCAAAAEAEGIEPGSEALREAIIGLLVAMPRYRTYFTPDHRRAEDVALMRAAADQAADGLRSRDVVDQIAGFVIEPGTPDAVQVQTRFQQVTGALIAKSHEDTAAFRQTAYLAACEVGADPDTATVPAEEMQTWIRRHPRTGLSLTSSHDTKRSEDARMRLVAMSRRPEAALSLIEAAAGLEAAGSVRPADLWYVVQAALAIWGPDVPDLHERLRDHMVKALREAKVITNWTHPDEDAEAPVLRLADDLLDDWQRRQPADLDVLVNVGTGLSLVQVALKFLLPGVPDVYQSCIEPDFSLTDPDNRRPVDFDSLGEAGAADRFAASKIELTRLLLKLRRSEADNGHPARVTWDHGPEQLHLARVCDGRTLTCEATFESDRSQIRIRDGDEVVFARSISDQEGILEAADSPP